MASERRTPSPTLSVDSVQSSQYSDGDLDSEQPAIVEFTVAAPGQDGRPEDNEADALDGGDDYPGDYPETAQDVSITFIAYGGKVELINVCHAQNTANFKDRGGTVAAHRKVASTTEMCGKPDPDASASGPPTPAALGGHGHMKVGGGDGAVAAVPAALGGHGHVKVGGGVGGDLTKIATTHMYVVGDRASAADYPTTALRDVFDSPEWATRVDDVGADLVLVQVSWEDIGKLAGLRFLSYRWADILKVSCGVKVPGTKDSDKYIHHAPRELAVDGLRAMKRPEGAPPFSGFLWIDFLSHLDIVEVKSAVLRHMGPLYSTGIVYPLYLEDFCRGLTEAKGESRKLLKRSLLAALRRGWIQQEISYGKLDAEIVRHFVQMCIAEGEFGVLGTFLRRRTRTVAWLFEKVDRGYGDKPNYVDLQGETKMAAPSMGMWPSISRAFGAMVLVASPVADESSSTVRAVHDVVKSAFFEANADTVTVPNPADLPGWTDLSEEDRNEKRYEHVDAVAEAQNEYFESNLPLVSRGLGPFLDEVVDSLCAFQPFDPTDFFSAVQLIRSFTESALTYEEDAFVATTQHAAATGGFKWHADADASVEAYENTAVLRACWATVVKHVSKQDWMEAPLQFHMHRSDARAWTAGFGAVPEVQKACSSFGMAAAPGAAAAAAM